MLAVSGSGIPLEEDQLPRADIWSFGVLVWSVWQFRAPWKEMTAKQIRQLVVEEGCRLGTNSKGFPKALKELLDDCWSVNPTDRPSMSCVATALTNLAVRWRSRWLSVGMRDVDT